MCRIHPGFIAHEVFEVALNLVSNFDDMSFDLTLQPKRERGVMDAGFASDFNLLDVVFVDDVLEAAFEFVVTILVVLQRDCAGKGRLHF